MQNAGEASQERGRVRESGVDVVLWVTGVNVAAAFLSHEIGDRQEGDG